MTFVIVVLSVFLGDLLLKKYVEANLPDDQEKVILGGKFRLRKFRNRGIALGGLSDHPVWIRKGTGMMILGLLVAWVVSLHKKGNGLRKTGLSLMLGGALCNWFDRFHQGAVTDYVSFNARWKKISRLVFNLSDFCIFIGGILAVLGKSGKRK